MSQPFDNRDYVSASSSRADVQKLAEKDAEIERLKLLIGELADVLDCFGSMLIHPLHRDLLQRAREAIK